jgi:pilus assembly protein FimV
MAAAAAALLGLWGSSALALSLGRIVVQSALGEPLRAEIEILDINAEEAASLKTTVASPDAFRAAGLDYNPAMGSVKLSLERRANGQAYIRMTSDRAINDPFVDMILEASWSSGRIVRDYTMLFDPPSMRPASSAPSAVATAPQVAPPATSSAVTAPSAAGSKLAPAAKPAVAAKPGAAPAPVAQGRKPAEAGQQQVTVKTGDTASKIAAAVKPASVSLDQMLVALLRSNPDAFLGGNINRIKAGAVLNVPGEQEAQATSTAEATQTIVAQSKDFNDYRRKLAGTAPLAQVAPAERKAAGSVQAKVEEKKPTAGAPDKLTLSKGAIQAKTAEENLAKERAAKDAAARQAELSKNLADLSKVAAAAKASTAAPAAGASTAKPATGITAAAPAVAPPTPAAASAPAAKAASAPAPAVAASAPAPVKKPVAVAPPPPPEPGLLDSLMDNPLLLAGGAGVVALLGGFAFYRSRQNKKAAPVDSAYLESRLQPDSFFGASGGQQIDTNDGAATGSSMVYSPSQLDAADDVDPVAEADVYLAYGRDLQAEEILKEALRTNPQRMAIHQKLLEIYAKRRDSKAFEGVANQAYKLTNGEGNDWQRICDLGLSFDPSNPLYQPGGAPFGGSESKLAALDVGAVLDQPPPPIPTEAASPVDLDLDLDFSLDDEAPKASGISEALATPPSEQTVRMPAPEQSTVRMQAAEPAPEPLPPMPSLDLELSSVPGALAHAPEPAAHAAASLDNALEFDLPSLPQAHAPAAESPSLNNEDFEQQAAVSFGSTAPAPLAAGAPEASKEADTGMLEFDLGSLSLDLGDSTEGTSLATPPAPDDPLATKLALAEEFNAIGDADGARALIEEVVAEATGDMKAKAQRALAAL